MRKGDLEARVDKALLPVLMVVVGGSALAMGGTIPSWFIPIGLLAVASALLFSFIGRHGRRVPAAPAIVLGLLGLFTLVQALPLPIAWVARLSPQAADVWARCLLPVGEAVPMASLSLDPGASLTEALKWVSYGATFFLAALVGRSRGASAGLGIVFASAAAVALVSLTHVAMGATTVYGLYTPRHAFPASQMGPFLNPNNLAGYLNLGALVGLGLIVSRVPPAPRWLLGLGLLLVVAMSLRTGSRGGVAALLLGLLAFGVWAAVSKSAGFAAGKIVSLAVSGLLVLGALFTIVGTDARFWSNLLSENSEKLLLPVWTVPVVKDFSWFGVGRGAFESAFFAYRPRESPGNIAYTHPENFIAQWFAEWGIPVAVIGLVALTATLARMRRGAFRSALVVGAACGIAALLLQNLVDLGLELAAVGTGLSAVLGSIWGSIRPPTEKRPRRSPLPVWVLRSCLILGLVAGVWSLANGATNIDEDRFRTKALLQVASSANGRDAVANERVRVEVLRMAKRHPADYYFPLSGAFAARLRGESPMPWIQRALERGPTVGRTHLLLGEVLLDRRLYAQGLMELRMAVTFEPVLATLAATIAVAHTQSGEDLLRAAPDGALGGKMLDAIGTALPPQASDALERIDSEALVRDETLVNPRRRLVERRLVALQQKQALCSDVDACTRAIEEHADAFNRVAPSFSLGARSRARLLWFQGRGAEAADLLASGCNPPGERVACLALRLQILETLKPPNEFESAAETFLDASCTEKTQCAEAYTTVARLRISRGNLQQGVSALERAAREDPSVERWLTVSTAAEQAGLEAAAANAKQQAQLLQKEKR